MILNYLIEQNMIKTIEAQIAIREIIAPQYRIIVTVEFFNK